MRAKDAATITPGYTYPDYLIDSVFSPYRFLIIQGSVQTGKSLAAAYWLLQEVANLKITTDPVIHAAWLCKTNEQAKIAFDIISACLGQSLEEGEDFKAKAYTRSITFTNSHGIPVRITFRSAFKSSYLRGFKFDRYVLDECQEIDEEIWDELINRGASRHDLKFRLVGNMPQPNHWFGKLMARCQSGEEKDIKLFQCSYVDALRAGIITQASVDFAKSHTLPWKFMRDWENRPFTSGDSCFGQESVDAAYDLSIEMGPHRLIECVKFAADIGRVRDWTVVYGRNANGEIIFEDRFRAGSPSSGFFPAISKEHPFPDIEKRINLAVAGRPCNIDCSNEGAALARSLRQKHGNYKLVAMNSGTNKKRLVDDFAAVLQSGLVRFSSSELLKELGSYQVTSTAKGNESYGAAPGAHDDCVSAAMLLYHGMVAAPKVWAISASTKDLRDPATIKKKEQERLKRSRERAERERERRRERFYNGEDLLNNKRQNGYTRLF